MWDHVRTGKTVMLQLLLLTPSRHYAVTKRSDLKQRGRSLRDHCKFMGGVKHHVYGGGGVSRKNFSKRKSCQAD